MYMDTLTSSRTQLKGQPRLKVYASCPGFDVCWVREATSQQRKRRGPLVGIESWGQFILCAAQPRKWKRSTEVELEQPLSDPESNCNINIDINININKLETLSGPCSDSMCSQVFISTPGYLGLRATRPLASMYRHPNLQ